MHLPLYPSGVVDDDGDVRSARLVERWFTSSVRDVIELACGDGFNLRELSARNPSRRFLGVDLLEEHVKRANEALAPCRNASAAAGDVEQTNLTDGSQDFAFCIEGLCHAADPGRAFASVHRILRPGGLLAVMDVWRSEGFGDAPAFVRRQAAAVEVATAVSERMRISEWIGAAERRGFRAVQDVDLTMQVRPGLARLAGAAQRFLARAMDEGKPAPSAWTIQNAAAGYLFPLLVELGVHTYHLVVLERRL